MSGITTRSPPWQRCSLSTAYQRVLVDHAVIVAGGEITKAAHNWLAENLDASKRSQIMFIDRDDILNLYVVVTNLPVPAAAPPPPHTPDPGTPIPTNHRSDIHNGNF